MNDAPQPRNFSYATFKATMRPEKQAVLDAVNDYEEQRKTPAVLPDYERKLKQRLSEFQDIFPAEFPDREWHVLIMRGMVASTLGDFAAAIALDQRSLSHAGSDDQRAISYLNLSEDYRYSGRFDESVEAATQAYRLNPSHQGLVCNLALALAKSGRREEARCILSVFLEGYNKEDHRSLFALYVKYSDEMQDLLDL